MRDFEAEHDMRVLQEAENIKNQPGRLRKVGIAARAEAKELNAFADTIPSRKINTSSSKPFAK